MKVLFFSLIAGGWLVASAVAEAPTSPGLTEWRLSPPVQHSGMCDASAAVALDAGTFVVANDEDNVLRVYRNDRPGEPRQALDLSGFLRVKEKSPETDIEGAARVGRRIYWVTSHARLPRTVSGAPAGSGFLRPRFELRVRRCNWCLTVSPTCSYCGICWRSRP